MIATLYISAPFVVAALAIFSRRRFGAWAAWLVILASALLFVRMDVRDVFWNKPGMLAGLDEAFGAICAAFVMALLLQSFGRDRPSPPVQIVAAGLTGVAVQWGYASASPEFRGGAAIPILFGAWAFVLVALGVRRRFRHRAE